MNNSSFLKKKAKESDAALATNAALRFLSRREYSKLELYQKLCLKYTADAAKSAVNKCVENDWLSEKRYIEMLHRHIISQNYGPLKFVIEAKKKGITSSLYDSLVRETDWKAVAITFLSKKISNSESVSYEDKQKILASLSRRGFSNSVCIEALEEYLGSSFEF